MTKRIIKFKMLIQLKQLLHDFDYITINPHKIVFSTFVRENEIEETLKTYKVDLMYSEWILEKFDELYKYDKLTTVNFNLDKIQITVRINK